MPFGPFDPFLGVKIHKVIFVKVAIFLLGILGPQRPYIDAYEWQTDA